MTSERTDGLDDTDDTEWVPGGHTFALCLTHDVDRPYKTYQGLYYALRNRDPRNLLDLLPTRNPYWTFPTIRTIEEDLGVRSAFYFLSEQSLFTDRPPSEWFSTKAWQLFAGRYDLSDPAIVDLVGDLEDGGWEVGLHGSYEAVDDRERLKREKQQLDVHLKRPVRGGRQHYFRLERPETWEHYRALGLQYDATFGDPTTVGFQHGYDPVQPFEDGFVSFPVTVMERALPDPHADGDAAWEACEQLLEEAAEERAVMTVLWHPRYFYERDHPGYAALYRRLIERAIEMGAWVGPPGALYDLAMGNGRVRAGDPSEMPPYEERADDHGDGLTIRRLSDEPAAEP